MWLKNAFVDSATFSFIGFYFPLGFQTFMAKAPPFNFYFEFAATFQEYLK
jgi:hypothetical protein